MAVIGVDPGVNGAIVYLPTQIGRRAVKPVAYRIPMKGKGRANDYDIEAICALMMELVGDSRSLIVIEHVTRPASIVRCRAIFETLAVTGDIDYKLVTPGVWKRYFGLSADKHESLALARQRFPSMADVIARVKDDGIAEAALIAQWGREFINGGY